MLLARRRSDRTGKAALLVCFLCVVVGQSKARLFALRAVFSPDTSPLGQARPGLKLAGFRSTTGQRGKRRGRCAACGASPVVMQNVGQVNAAAYSGPID